MGVVHDILALALAAAPWLLLGFLAAGVIQAVIPRGFLERWLGGNGPGAITRAAVTGVPLPLCSCGAIPTAFGLHRAGAGRGPTTAFLVSTPGVGMDSVAITYAVFGPFMVVARVLGAFVTAVATGLLVAVAGARPSPSASAASRTPSPVDRVPSNVGGSHTAFWGDEPGEEAGHAGSSPSGGCSSCGGGCSSTPSAHAAGGAPEAGRAAVAPPPATVGGGNMALDLAPPPVATRLRAGIRYAFTDLLDDISGWLVAGLLVAGLVMAFLPPELLTGWLGGGLLLMVVMAVAGIPMYICATAATPIAAAFFLAGMSPGTALVFLLAGPITSLATLGAYRKELGGRALAAYLTGVLVTAVAAGLTVDLVVDLWSLDLRAQAVAAQELLPGWIEWPALILFLAVAFRPLRRGVARYFA